MHVHWYWPFLRSEDIGLAEAVAHEPVRRLVVQTIDRPGVPRSTPSPRIDLRNDLPEVSDARPPAPGWWADRTRTYLRRRRRRAEAARGADLVHIWFLNRFTDTIDVPRLARHHPLVVHVHDVLPHTPRLPSPVSRRVLGRIYRSDARLVVHHRALADRLAADFAVDPARVSVIPHMVRTRTPAPASTRRGDRVLFFGTLRHNKGLAVLLEAIAQAGPGIRWEIMGRGEPDLEAAVGKAAETNPEVTARIGHVSESDKAAAFARADLVVLPYTAFESQSGVLHDAYAHGVPVVVTDVGALGVTVREDETGAVVPPGDARALRQAIAALLDDRARYDHSAAAAREVAAARSPERIAAALHSLYRDIVAGTA